MLRHVISQSHTLKLCAIAAIGVMMYWLSQASSPVTAQEGRSTMSALLSQLRSEEITFQFVVPLIADENLWTIPDRLDDGPEDATTIQIDSIGDDHICFRRRAGQAIDVICTPFSNIASVSYLDMK